MKTKKILYICFLAILIFPLAGTLFPFYKTKKLSGYSEEKKKPVLSAENLFEGLFQHSYEEYFNDKILCRNDLVRLRNQLNYSLFNVILNDKIIVGKENTFYEKGYIYNAFYGLYTGDEAHFQEKSAKLAKIKDTLTKMGKEFLYVAAPGKGTYFSENIPSYLMHARMNIIPQKRYLEIFDSLGIKTIDFDKWFIQLKKQNTPPLFSRYGVHYNKYGCYLVVDSLTKYFNKSYPFMPELVLDSVCQDYSVWEYEHDCYEAANLIFSPKKEKLSHPYIHYKKKEGKRLKCIFAGDSYIWPLTLLDINREYFDSSQYWYYFNEVSYSYTKEKSSIDKIDILKELANTDVVIMVFTNATTLDLDNGFTDTIYELYYGKQKK